MKDLELDLSKELENTKPRKAIRIKSPSKARNSNGKDLGITRGLSSNECSTKYENTSQLSPRTAKLQDDLDTSKVNPWACE